MGKSISEIAEQLGSSPSYISEKLSDVQAQFSLEMYELVEQILLLNLGRAEMLIKAVFPQAMAGDLRAVKAFTDLAKLEIEWHKEIGPTPHQQARETDDDTIIVEAFEQTLSSTSSLYDIALGHINEDWLSRDAIAVDDIYSNDPNKHADTTAMSFKGVEPPDARISKIEDMVKKLVVDSEDEDGE